MSPSLSCVTKRQLICVLIAIGIPANASDVAAPAERGRPAGVSAGLSEQLPECLVKDKDPRFKEIKDYQKANNTNRETIYTELKRPFEERSIGDKELVARLVYAETLASRCGKDDEASSVILEVILNRVRKDGNNPKKTVFKYKQFASSLHFYERNEKLKGDAQIREFLCPTNATTWKIVAAKTKAMMDGQKKQTMDPGAYYYYLYKHFDDPSEPANKDKPIAQPVVLKDGENCVVARIDKY